MELISERHPYPLVAVHARKLIATRYALIGDAAVGMHPVTAHGFNLGLRGQHQLANNTKPAKALRKVVLRLSNNCMPVKWLIKQTLTETKMAKRTHLGL